MASPSVEGRVEPHRKAHFSLHLSDRIGHSDTGLGSYSGVKYNHKPSQGSDNRSTTLTSTSANAYNLQIEDEDSQGERDVFNFTGTKSTLNHSYVLVFNTANHEATLEPLPKGYSFNIATKNGKDISSKHQKIYPKKRKEDSQGKEDELDIFGENSNDVDIEGADANNPFDFRHFISKETEKRGDESEYNIASSPDYRTGSAANTPVFGARKAAPAAAAPAPKPKAAEPAPRKRKTATPNPLMKPKKAPAPTVRLERRATDTVTKAKGTKGGPTASKIKSKEIIDSSDDSDIAAERDVPSSPPPARRSPTPPRRQYSDDDDDDAEGESDGDGGLEIEVPDARPSRKGKGALAGLGLGQNLGVGGQHLRSPSNGPISLASATSSAAASPNPHSFASRRMQNTQDEIDFGDLGGDDAEGEDDDEDDYDDRDVPHMALDPPTRQPTGGHDRKQSIAVPADDDEDDLEKMMMDGLLGGDSSEESEEE